MDTCHHVHSMLWISFDMCLLTSKTAKISLLHNFHSMVEQGAFLAAHTCTYIGTVTNSCTTGSHICPVKTSCPLYSASLEAKLIRSPGSCSTVWSLNHAVEPLVKPLVKPVKPAVQFALRLSPNVVDRPFQRIAICQWLS